MLSRIKMRKSIKHLLNLILIKWILPSNRFVTIKQLNNRLAQGQLNMADTIEKINQNILFIY